MKLSLGALGGILLLAACAPTETVDDSGASADSALGEDAFDRYAAFARAEGLDPSDRATGEATVIGLRGASFDGASHVPNYVHAFDDTFVVLKSDGTVERFHGSTHPFENAAPGVPDVNGDRVADVGMIKPGVYDANPRDRLVANQASWDVAFDGSGRVPGWRDTSHDGTLTETEKAAANKRGDRLTDVLFHQGENGSPPVVGCQVLPASEMKSFTRAVGGGKAHFRYLLVDMTGRDPSDLPR